MPGGTKVLQDFIVELDHLFVFVVASNVEFIGGQQVLPEIEPEAGDQGRKRRGPAPVHAKDERDLTKVRHVG